MAFRHFNGFFSSLLGHPDARALQFFVGTDKYSRATHLGRPDVRILLEGGDAYVTQWLASSLVAGGGVDL